MGMDRMKPSALESAKKLGADFLKDETSSGTPPSSEDMTKVLRMALAGMALYAAAPGTAAAEKRPQSHRVERAAEHTFSKKDFELVSKNVFFEAALENPVGQLAVAQVTFARVASGRWGHSIPEVVNAKHQFSWTAHEKPLTGVALDGVKNLTDVFASRFRGKSADDIVKELSAITGLPASTLYYKRADWDENNPKEARMTEETKAVFRSLIWVKNIDKHAFYIDAVKTASVQKR